MEEGKYETAARFAKIFFVITCPCFDEALLPADNCETFLLEILSVQIVHQSIEWWQETLGRWSIQICQKTSAGGEYSFLFHFFTGRFKISLSYPWFYLFSLSGYRPLYSYQSSEAELSNLWNGSVWLPQERCQGIHPTTLSSYCSCWSFDFDYPIRDQQEHLQSCELMSIWD